MGLTHLIDLHYTVAGFLVGALVGATGVGGGALMTPMLILLFGVSPATAVGTDLLYAGLTKFSGAFVRHLHGGVDWRVARRLAYGSAPAAALTLLALNHFGERSGDVDATIRALLGVALLLTAAALLFRATLVARTAPFFRSLSDARIAWLTVTLGVALGVLVSVSSVGAGAVGVTFLLMLYPEMPIARLIGADIAHAVPLALIAGAGHWAMGSVNGLVLFSLLAGSIPGVALASHFSARAPDRLLRVMLAGALILVGAKLAL